jgi:hypothetical protein
LAGFEPQKGVGKEFSHFSDFSLLKLKLFIAACACLSFTVKYISSVVLDEGPIHSRTYLLDGFH